MSSLYACRRIVQLPDFAAAAWLELAEHEGVTNAFVVPTMLSRVVDHLETIGKKPHIASLRSIAYGGGKMPQRSSNGRWSCFPGSDFTNAYGLTETSSTITLLGPDDHRAAQAADETTSAAALPRWASRCRASRSRSATRTAASSAPTSPARSTCAGDQVSGEYLERKATRRRRLVPHTRRRLHGRGRLPVPFRPRRRRDHPRRREHVPGEIEDVLLTHAAVADACAVRDPLGRVGRDGGAPWWC